MKIMLLINILNEEIINQVGYEDWLWALFGVVVYNYLLFVFAKDETDGTRKKFNWQSYKAERWDNWIFSFLMVPIIVIYGEQLWYYVMEWQEKEWKFFDVIFLGSGLLAEGLYFGLKKIKLMINALKGTNK